MVLKCAIAGFALVFLNSLAAYPAPEPVSPFIVNYSKREYRAANQNWSIAQSPEGILYFANSEGLLEYDGAEWRLMEMPNSTIVRSVAIDGKGRIYAGSYQEFGYWEEDERGAFHYTSLSALLKDYEFSNEEIWRIILDGERVYFQAFSDKLFLYEQGKVRVLTAPDAILFAFNVNGQIILQGINKGLYLLEHDSFRFWEGSELFAGNAVLSILPYSGDQLLIGTATQGIYLYNGSRFLSWESPASEFSRAYQLNKGIAIPSGYVFGSIQNGAIITDFEGNILRHLNRESGLQNNTVLSLHYDQQENLWLGLDNGIDYAELGERFAYSKDGSGLLGSVYDAVYFGDRLYLGTNHGLFYRNRDASFSQAFEFVPGSHGQVWSLDVLNGQLLCGHNEGTFLIERPGGEARKISDVTGGWMMRAVPGKSGLRIQATYTGLAVFRWDGRRWQLSHRIPGFTQPVRYIEFDGQGNLWASRAYQGVYRLRLSEDLQRIDRMDYFDANAGFPTAYNINVFRIGQQLVFATGRRIYTYDELEGKIVPFDRLNAGLEELQQAHRILPAGRDRYWFIGSASIGLVRIEDFQVKQRLQAPFSHFLPQMVSEYQQIVHMPDSAYLFCLDDGIASLPDSALDALSSPAARRLFIRRVVNLSDSARLLPFAGSGVPDIPYNKSNIKVEYASPSYGYSDKRFQIFLEGFDEAWSAPTSFHYKEYTNLPAGTYTFRVRLLEEAGKTSPEASFRFRVLPPWYASWWAYGGYGLGAAWLLIFFRRRYRRKLQRKHQDALERLRHEKEEQLREERLLNQQRLVELENEKLQAEIAAKSNELANSTMAIIKKNELLISIKDELARIRKHNHNGFPSEMFRKLGRLIDHNISNDDDWRIFEQSFNRAHEDFFRKLKEHHPELTPNDLRLCAYLKMNISSKEIAPLLNISVRGVEIRRYRLRKKLHLEHDANLVEYMMQL